MSFKLNMENKYKLMSLGIDPNLRHYGLVTWYEPYYWNSSNFPGKGRIGAYIPYAKGKKWRSIDVLPEDIEGTELLRSGNFVGFAMSLGPSGLKATNLLKISEHETEDS